MAIQVIDRRVSHFVAEESNLKSAKEVVMSKVHAIVVKQQVPSNPSKEVVVRKQEVDYKTLYQQAIAQVSSLKQQVAAMAIRLEPKEVTEGRRIMQGGTAPKKHQEVKKQVIRINAETASARRIHNAVYPAKYAVAEVEEMEEEVKAKPDMHEAGYKAIVTRMVNYVHKHSKEVQATFQGAKAGEVRKVLVDAGMPTEKYLKMRLDKVEGRLCSFTLKVETKAGARYAQVAFQF